MSITTALQWIGGVFYLLNKIFFSLTERNQAEKKKRQWRIASWVVYLIGLPPIVALFALKRNWMAASVEAGGAPAMLIGLIIALRGQGQEPRWLDWVARITVVLGITYSLIDFGGITTINQVLELGVVVGFLVGTYLLAKQRPGGYYWFMLMNGSNAMLMAVEDYHIMAIQQVLSFIFIFDALLIERRCRTRLVV